MSQTIFYELSRGFAYRRITHEKLRIYTTWLPMALTTLIIVFWFILPQKPVLTGNNSLSSSSLALISTLPGFYFAGLAAVATFGGANMDKIMKTPSPTLKTAVTGGTWIDNELSNRQFLSYLFSYLVLMSLMLSILLLIFSNIGASIEHAKGAIVEMRYGEIVWSSASFLTASVIVAFVSSMVVSTLHAVFFLAEKIHQP